MKSSDNNFARITFEQAYYVKLGKGGKWFDSSLEHGLLRFGWKTSPLSQINAKDWSPIKQGILAEAKTKGSGIADFNALKRLCESSSSDMWITFHSSRLWWCRLADGLVEEDETSKFRRTAIGWRDTDLKGKRLLVNAISGFLSQTQGFQATVCEVKEAPRLQRLLNGDASEAYRTLTEARQSLEERVAIAIRELYWKDFEILVDLVFRDAGWKRTSVLGEVMKYADLELEAPVTGDRYQVQVKSKATLADFTEYAEQFSAVGFRRMYFVVHTPDAALAKEGPKRLFPNVELLLPDRLASLVVDAGLTGWLMEKVR
jgi:hypothetical protein